MRSGSRIRRQPAAREAVPCGLHGQQPGLPALLRGRILGDLDLVGEHLAGDRSGGEQRDHGIGGAHLALDLPRPVQPDRHVPIDKHPEAARRELCLQ